jgi:N-glycosylase/DNA lyase
MFLPSSEINLPATLASGQTFSTQRLAGGAWSGWIGQEPFIIRPTAGGYKLTTSATAEAVRYYFQLDFDLTEALATFPGDPHLTQALAFAPQLRILRQDPWETLVNFICSAVKQIPHIEAINRTLRERCGAEGRFPSAQVLMEAGEPVLRAASLGFRAKYVAATARKIVTEALDLEAWHALSTPELKDRLLTFPGVGEKIANCVMLFAYHRYEVFPIDVWVERVLKKLYCSKMRRPTAERLRTFAHSYFGPYRGYAQQYLFHWIRTKTE